MPAWLATIISVLGPIVFITIISLVFVPGATVPRGTPSKLIWQRRLWELHIGLLGLALSMCASWFITNAMKNLFGKPRPDLLSRCQPDLENLNKYLISATRAFGDIATMAGKLVDPSICKNPDKSKLDDGFRSYPSGHSSSAAAGTPLTLTLGLDWHGNSMLTGGPRSDLPLPLHREQVRHHDPLRPSERDHRCSRLYSLPFAHPTPDQGLGP